MQGLAGKVFDTITRHFNPSRTLESLLEANFSFEQWINCEAYVACKNAGYECDGSVRYTTVNDSGHRSLLRGDLLIGKSGRSVMLETKIIGPGTLNKYRAAINDDFDKLSALVKSTKTSLEGLLLIVMYSNEEKKLLNAWSEWLSKIELFNPNPREGAVYKCANPLPKLKNGEIKFHGWRVAK